MPELPRIPGREAVRALERLGFEQVRQRGAVMSCLTSGEFGCVVPLHEELKTGTLHVILKRAQVDPEDFKRQL